MWTVDVWTKESEEDGLPFRYEMEWFELSDFLKSLKLHHADIMEMHIYPCEDS